MRSRPTNVRRLVAGFVCLTASCSPVWAQEPVIRTNVPLVLVPVTVTDAKGKPVDGLQQEDFILDDDGDEEWKKLAVPGGDLYAWDPKSTYVKHPPYFVGMAREPDAVRDIAGARVLLLLGDSITTDHISPAGSIKKSGPAGAYLIAHGVDVKDFNSYGARRGNDEVMVRGTFANVRLRNLLAPGTEGGVTRHLPSGDQMSVYDAAVRYASVDGRPVSELRVGMTFGFPLILSQPMSAETPFAGAPSLSGFRLRTQRGLVGTFEP